MYGYNMKKLLLCFLLCNNTYSMERDIEEFYRRTTADEMQELLKDAPNQDMDTQLSSFAFRSFDTRAIEILHKEIWVRDPKTKLLVQITSVRQHQNLTRLNSYYYIINFANQIRNLIDRESLIPLARYESAEFISFLDSNKENALNIKNIHLNTQQIELNTEPNINQVTLDLIDNSFFNEANQNNNFYEMTMSGCNDVSLMYNFVLMCIFENPGSNKAFFQFIKNYIQKNSQLSDYIINYIWTNEYFASEVRKICSIYNMYLNHEQYKDIILNEIFSNPPAYPKIMKVIHMKIHDSNLLYEMFPIKHIKNLTGPISLDNEYFFFNITIKEIDLSKYPYPDSIQWYFNEYKSYCDDLLQVTYIDNTHIDNINFGRITQANGNEF